MTFKGKIQSANLDKDTLTIHLPKDFWKEHTVATGEVILTSASIKPIFEKELKEKQ